VSPRAGTNVFLKAKTSLVPTYIRAQNRHYTHYSIPADESKLCSTLILHQVVSVLTTGLQTVGIKLFHFTKDLSVRDTLTLIEGLCSLGQFTRCSKYAVKNGR
jgi:hypothetical protein